MFLHAFPLGGLLLSLSRRECASFCVSFDEVPTVRDLDWGTISISTISNVYNFKDVLLCPGKVMMWDWGSHYPRTRHEPGVQVVDILPICENVDYLIIGCGMHCKLNVKAETCKYCRDNNIELLALPSIEATIKYTELITTKRVALALHSTC